VGYINDENPTAFTYGSAAFNARIIVTKGMYSFVTKEELDAVVAHELGHIIHNDFIIMSMASTLLQILYDVYVIGVESSKNKSSSDGKKGNPLVIVGLVSIIFYWIGMYLVLFLVGHVSIMLINILPRRQEKEAYFLQLF